MDDDLSEIDTTPEQLAQYMAEAEPAKLIERPRFIDCRFVEPQFPPLKLNR